MTIGEEPAAIDLAREADFRLGDMAVCPSASRVIVGGVERRVQPRVMEVLVALARQPGRTITRDQLIETCWGGRFVSENAVNRVLAQVRALTRLTDPPPFTLETVPRVGVRLIAADATPGDGEAEFPPAALDAGREEPDRSGRLDPRLVVVAALVVIVALWAGWRVLSPVRAASANGRVDVASFAALSDDPATRTIAAELPQAVARALSRNAAAGSARDAELRLTGSVARSAQNAVYEVQVADRASGAVLWSERLPRGAQEEQKSPGGVASVIAAVLHCAIEDRRTARVAVSRAAFGLYLNACASWVLDDDNGQRMLAVTRKLVQAAPRFAGAHAMHSIAAAQVAATTETPAGAAALHAEARTAAETALRLDPKMAKAYAGLALNEGVLSERMQHDWAAEERYLRKGLALDPELAPLRNEYGALLRSVGRTTEAIEFMRASAANDDLLYGPDPRPAMMLAAKGDLAASADELARLEARDGISLASVRWTIAVWWEDPKAVLPKLRALTPPDSVRRLDCLEPYLRTLEARRAAHARGLPPACDILESNWRVRLLAREGDVDGAFAALQGRIPGGPVLFYYPETRALRADPRFWRLAQQIGLLAYWRTSGHWPDFCAEPGQDCAKAAAVPSA